MSCRTANNFVTRKNETNYFKFYALPSWKLKLENPARNPTQNPNSKKFAQK